MKKPSASDAVAASALPAEVKLYLAAALRRRLPFSLKPALRKDPRGVSAAAARLVAGSAAALGCSGAEALFATGFDPANMAPHRLEAALAELAAVLLLRREGFSGLELIRPNSGRTADISAEKSGLRWAFEVRSLQAGPAASAALLAGKFRAKLPQAKNAMKKYGFDRAAVILVREPWAEGLAPDPGLAALAAAACAAEMKKPAAHVCLLDRGRFGVHPPW